MHATHSAKFQELVSKLREIFQIDRPDLDFGIYRILNSRQKEINDYLEKKLPAKVAASLAAGNTANMASVQEELQKAIDGAAALGVVAESVPKVVELKAKLAKARQGGSEYENAVFSHLLTFFSRYYEKGDFLSLRRYKGETYAIPYAGEEVVLHWANKDQYYTKSGENFTNYSFRLEDGRLVHFRLVAADTAKDNNKDNEKERRFTLVEAKTITRVDDEGEEYEETLVPVEEITGDAGKKELIIYFEYKAQPKGSKQEALITGAVETVLAHATVKAHWLALEKRTPTEKKPQRTLLEKHLTDYTAKHTADYFIHKNLGAFLRRELDFYIKNEVLHLDDVQNANTFADIEQNLRMIQCLRAIAGELIVFLAQLEDFQKKLWLKKKFVVETNYCITLDRVPESLFAEIAKNQAQIDEWAQLFAVQEAPGFTQPLTPAFLQANTNLVLDTRFFDDTFKAKLLASIENVDEQCDGLLVHSENFQALNLLQERYREQVKCVYIDPPYNTEQDRQQGKFIYKDNFSSSSWIALIEGRLEQAKKLQRPDASTYISINEDELFNLKSLLDTIYGKDCYLANFAIKVRHENRILKADKDFHEVYESLIAYRTSVAHRPTKRLENNTSNDEYIWSVSVNGNPTLSITVGAKTIDLFAPEHYSFTRGIPDETKLKRINIRGSLREGNSSGRFYVASLEPLKDQYPNYLFRVPNMGGDSLGHRFFWLPDSNGKRNNGDYFQGVPNDRNTIKSVPYANYCDFESEFNRCSHEGGIIFRDGKKPVMFLTHLLSLAGVYSTSDSLVLDFFAGSGGTGHAVINLNREYGGKRKYILVEMGDYFNTVLKPRIAKVVYASEWKNGKPVARNTGISHCFKYLRLESYEDALNNLKLQRSAQQTSMLDLLPEKAQNDYLVQYMLDVESKGSLLSVEDFAKPFHYTLNVSIDSAGAFAPRTVDLVETFNYLLGLRVKHLDSQKNRGFVTVEGTLPSGESCLVLWRDCETLDYEALTELCKKLAINPADSEYDVVYINGDHNIPTVLTQTAAEGGATKTLKLRQIETEFLERMFAVEGA